ncbi:hypothetical protein AAFC00_005683 [Neodothiora populina]|uniref:Uncharacterized protein n=1 Tax=Neodothiora populina TaxID=2781224 RepID=A0ABR3P5T7_9PEZI
MFHHQLQSPLVSLPGEVRNEIFSLAMVADLPIVNPHYGTRGSSSIRPKNRQISPIGVSVTQSCRTLHDEIDISPLYKYNTFVFTRVAHMQAFSRRLTREQLRCIHSVTIDLREAVGSFPQSNDQENQDEAAPPAAVIETDIIGNEWLHYLTCDHSSSSSSSSRGVWCSKLTTFRSDFPDLKEIVIDLTGWQPQFAGLRKDGWRFLQRLLSELRNVDSVSLKGKCLECAHWNPKPAPWGLGPWFSPAFSHDDTSLIELLGDAARGAGVGERKVFAWSICAGVTTLGVSIQRTTGNSIPAAAAHHTDVIESGVGHYDALVRPQLAQHLATNR